MEATAPAPAAVDQLCVDTIRTLSMDAVQRANSGHPGTPMALAPLGHRLFTKHMKHDPAAPDWADRDRFVLSCGHASMLIYSLLHLSGYGVTLDDLKNFRQLHSPTAGHPERGEVPGVEFTTGPLGQGVSSAVGMAIAERMLAAQFNRDGLAPIVDHRTWVIASDGDLMEGVASETASLAGTLKLGNLIVFWDDNKITIDGTTDISFTEDVAARYAAYGWQTLRLDDVDDMDAIDSVVAEAIADDRPTLVVTRTHIGIGSPRQDTPKAHGEPLGEENIRITKENYGWTYEPFQVPDEVRASYAGVGERGAAAGREWDAAMDAYRSAHPELADEFRRRMGGQLPEGWSKELVATSFEDAGAAATRQSSGQAINLIAPYVPELVGGSADLAGSNLTDIDGASAVSADDFSGRTIHFGIREHAMGAIINGVHAHGGLRGFGATFLVFSDYMRPAIRLSALMGLPSIWVYTHDSVHLGEDGPTHQPIEHLASLRAMPNLLVLRPAEANETLAAWKIAIEQTDRPVAMALTRQKLQPFTYADGSRLNGAQVERGAYVLRDTQDGAAPAVILMATGSEVELALAAADVLEQDGTSTRVVSMPCHELFLEQPQSYRDEVLPSAARARVSVEAGTTFGWERFIGDAGESVGIDRFGLSAPGEIAADALGLNVDSVVAAAHRSLATVHGSND